MAEEASISNSAPLRRAWQIALAFFVLAGLTGAFFRFAVASGTTFGLSLGNVRHAHSHTMYFGWVTPALMALIAFRVSGWGGSSIQGARRVINLAFVTALLAYAPFLLFGYAPADVAGARVPLSMMGAGLNIVAWYWFVGLYTRSRNNGITSLSGRMLDLAVLFLVLATLGAWGLSVMGILGIDHVTLRIALTHVFLDIFSEGWFVLAVLGLAAADVRLDGAAATWGIRMMAAGIPFTFALGMPPSMVSPLFRILSSVGGALTAIGSLVLATAIWRRLAHSQLESSRWIWRFVLVALAAKAFAEGIVSVSPGASWGAIPHLRIIYLHVVLLGFVSVGLIAAARSAWGFPAPRDARLFVITVALVLASLLPFLPAWPGALRGTWLLWLAGIAAVGPVLAAAKMCLSSTRTERAVRPPG